jgi:hypothetical protein
MDIPAAKLPEGEKWVIDAVLILVLALPLALLCFIVAAIEKSQFLGLIGLILVLLWFLNLKRQATVRINGPKNLIDGD